MSHLFEPFALGSLRLENRIVIAPMCQYSADRGRATDWHMIHLGQMTLSSAGLLIIEATAVSPEGRITPDDLGLYDDDTEAALRRVLQGVRTYSTMPIAVQLAHAGRRASCRVPWHGGAQIPPGEATGWQTEAPSPVPHAPGENPPAALDAEGLERVRQCFARAARRSADLGFDGIEIHAAHGYLLHEFLSPIANHRRDEYGGSLDNRMRFPLEVFETVRAAFPADKPVWVRLSASDWVPGGWDIKGTLAFCEALKARGCAAIHASSGGVSPNQDIKLAPGYQVPFASRIKAETGLPTIAVGLITTPEQAESILAGGDADAVSLARAMLYDPRWPWHAAAALGERVHVPNQYLRSQPREYKDLFMMRPSDVTGRNRASGTLPGRVPFDRASIGTTLTDVSRLTQLGHAVTIPRSPEEAILERVPNPHDGTLYVTRFTAPEFTSLCPMTGQPDFAHIVIDYVPKSWLVESKSLKLYLTSFRNHGAFHEDCTVRIGKDLVALLDPTWLRIGGYWYPRGGIPIDVFWQTAQPPEAVWLPDTGVPPYRGRG